MSVSRRMVLAALSSTGLAGCQSPSHTAMAPVQPLPKSPLGATTPAATGQVEAVRRPAAVPAPPGRA